MQMIKRTKLFLKDMVLKVKLFNTKTDFKELQKNESPIVVFWSMDAGMKSHYISQCILSRTLIEKGHNTLMIRCFKNLQRCMVMDASRLSINATNEVRANLCHTCASNAVEIGARYGLPMMDIKQLVNENFNCELQDIINNFKGDLSDFSYDKIKFGKICTGEVIRTHKLNRTGNFTGNDFHLLRQYIHTAVYNYVAFKKLTETHHVCRLVYFGDYSFAMGLATFSKMNNIAITNISHTSVNNIDRSNIVLMPALSLADYFRRASYWNEWGKYALLPEQIQEIGNDLFYRLTNAGFTIFSPLKTLSADDLISKLNLSRSRKLLVAFTSSLDEVLATQLQYEGLNVNVFPDMEPFENQIDWLVNLTNFVEQSADMQLVVRIHPREGQANYNGDSSEHLTLLRSTFKQEFENVRFIWPEEDISSYDLGEIADVVLIGWTSLGLEMARLGVPVLAAFRYTPCPLAQFIEWAATKAEYLLKLNFLLTSTPSLLNMISAFRWFNLLRLSSSVSIKDIDPDNDFSSLPDFKMPKNSNIIEDVLVKGKDLVELNMMKLKENSSEAEQNEIKIFCRKAVWFLLFGELRTNDYTLKLVENERMLPIDNIEPYAYAAIDGYQIIFQYKESVTQRYSPMITRLIMLSMQDKE